MSVIQAENLPDLVLATLKDLGEGKVTDLSTALQDFPTVQDLLSKNRVMISSGTGIQFNLVTRAYGSARAVGLYSTDNISVPNLLAQASVGWRHVEGSYAYDAREIDMNTGARQIVSELKVRRDTCMVSQFEFLEDRAWRLPLSTDPLNIYGYPYWIVKNNTQGFNGGAPAGYTTVAGVDPSVVTRWQNYTDQYAAVSPTDLIPKLWLAMDKTNFRPPVKMASYDTGDNFFIGTNLSVYEDVKKVAMGQNDNIGVDMDPMDGRPTLRRRPITWVPQLDQDTTNPIYLINRGSFKTAVRNGWWMRETVIPKMPGQHTVTGVFMDSSLQLVCYNRRKQAVLALNTGLPTSD